MPGELGVWEGGKGPGDDLEAQITLCLGVPSRVLLPCSQRSPGSPLGRDPWGRSRVRAPPSSCSIRLAARDKHEVSVALPEAPAVGVAPPPGEAGEAPRDTGPHVRTQKHGQVHQRKRVPRRRLREGGGGGPASSGGQGHRAAAHRAASAAAWFATGRAWKPPGNRSGDLPQ